METSLPDLPFVNYGTAELEPYGSHSAVTASPRACPRTDLETFTPWTSFLSDIDQAVQSATRLANLPQTPFAIYGMEDSFVENEEALRMHASVALHTPVRQVLHKLGVMGRFILSNSGNPGIVGSPDFAWITSPIQAHAKLVVSVSTASCGLTVIEFHWCRSNTRRGGRQIWWICLLPVIAVFIAPKPDNPCTLSNSYMGT
jgi:hypothetical protein